MHLGDFGFKNSRKYYRNCDINCVDFLKNSSYEMLQKHFLCSDSILTVNTDTPVIFNYYLNFK